MGINPSSDDGFWEVGVRKSIKDSKEVIYFTFQWTQKKQGGGESTFGSHKTSALHPPQWLSSFSENLKLTMWK